ncbi:MAG: DHH family phosphoesterase, partial [Candidatus Altiarchaeales archaeon]|nr:DHH family phosphoesterase [Candidatus Altiarchaeales archaeon]
NMGIELRRGDGSWRSYADLDLEERKKLTTALYVTLLDFNVPEFIIQGMVGEVYTLLNEKKRTELRDAKEYATVLNACGRQEQPEIGVGVCLGGRGRDLDKAKDLLTEHRRKLKEGLNFLNSSGVEETENLYYFNAGGMIDENIIGVIAGMSYGARIPTTKGGVMGRGKPIRAFAKDKDNPDMLKVSARANWDLVRRGLHLGNALRELSGELGGEGGGHDIAAGARIPQNTRSEFLDKINEIFNKQLKGI